MNASSTMIKFKIIYDDKIHFIFTLQLDLENTKSSILDSVENITIYW